MPRVSNRVKMVAEFKQAQLNAYFAIFEQAMINGYFLHAQDIII